MKAFTGFKDFTDSFQLVKGTNIKLLFLLLFNAADGLLTYLGVTRYHTVEMNVIMAGVVSDYGSLTIYKLLLPSYAILLAAYLINRYDYSRMLVARALIDACFIVYSIVMANHAFWLAAVLLSL